MATLGKAAAKVKDGCGHAAGVRIERWQNLQDFQCQMT
jgi:hypothetical protein